jgi:ribosomal protein S18 acetylase RimI-like enzyme
MKSDSAPIRLEKEQVEQASGVLARAFRDDPELLSLVPDQQKRQKLLLTMFRPALRHAIEHGEVYAVSPAIEGVAVWLPSTAPKMSLWAMLRGGGLGLLFGAGLGLARKMKEDEDFALKLRRQLAPFPHCYLAVLGVDPEFQGKGCASRLLKPMLARLAREKTPAYLETSIEDYVALYRHFGFEVIKETALPGTGTKMWVMLRKND